MEGQLVFQKAPQMVTAAGMLEFAESLGFDLSDTLTRHPKNLAHFLECMGYLIPQTKAHTQNTLFLRAQGMEHLVYLIAQVTVDHRLQRRSRLLVLDQRAEFSVSFTNVIFEGHSAFCDLQGIFDLLNLQSGVLRDLFWQWLAPQFDGQRLRGAHYLVENFDHMDRDTNRLALLRNGTGNGLTNPPTGVRAELKTPMIIEFVHRTHQTDIALLNEIQEGQPPVDVLLGNAHDQPQIGFDHLFLRLFQALFNGLEAGNEMLDRARGTKRLCKVWQ